MEVRMFSSSGFSRKPKPLMSKWNTIEMDGSKSLLLVKRRLWLLLLVSCDAIHGLRDADLQVDSLSTGMCEDLTHSV